MRIKMGIICALAGVAALGTPGVASAHTGSVACTPAGVVFHYNANFERDTPVTEYVGTANRVITVREHEAMDSVWAGITGTTWAGAKWRGGSIRWTKLVCPAPATPPVAPPAPPVTPPSVTPTPPATTSPPVAVTPPAAPVSPPAVTPATPAVTPPAPAAAVKPPAKPPKCPKGTTRNVYNAKTGVLICLRIVHDLKPGVGGRTKRTPKHTSAGVTG